MKYMYTIPEIPPSNNKYIGRNQRWQYQKEKKRWATMIEVFCKPKPEIPFEKARVTLQYFFPNKIRRDPDNYSGKMVLDGLVKAGIIVDDSFDCIALLVGKGEIDKNNPHLVLIIEEI